MEPRTLQVLWVSEHREPLKMRFPTRSTARRFRVLHLRDSEEVSSTHRGETTAVLLDLAGIGSTRDAVQRISRVSQQTLAPVLLLGGPEDVAFPLEATAAGATTFLPEDPAPFALGTHTLLAIEANLIRCELRRGHAAFGSLLQDLDFGVMLVSIDGGVERANRAMHEILEYRDHDLAGSHLKELTHAEDHDTLALFAELGRGERHHYVVRQRFLTSRGRTVWLDLSANLIDEPAIGEPFCVFQLVDATREIHTRHELAVSRRHYRTLFERSPVPTYVLDADSLRVLDANPAAETALGHPREALLRLGPDALWAHAGQADIARNLLRDRREVGPVRVRQRHRDGRVVTGELQAVSFEYGHRPAYLVMVRSMEENLRLEEKLAHAQQTVAIRDLGLEMTTSLGELAQRLEREVEGLRQRGDTTPSPELERMQRLLEEISGLSRRFSTPNAPAPAEGREEAEGPAATGSGLLLVDDDDAVRFVISEMLEMDHHRVIEASTAEGALAAFVEDGDIELVVSDVSLPDMPGPELVRELRRRDPALKILIVSGYLDEALTARGILGVELPFLAKPFSAEELRGTVREILDAPPPELPEPPPASPDA